MSDHDVVVVGAGPAGLAAASAAAEAGADVIVLEQLDRVGGNATRSSGYTTFVDSPPQHRQGIRDSVDRFEADAAVQAALHADKTGIIWDRELTRVFARESAATYDLLAAMGVGFGPFVPRPQQHSVDRMLSLKDPAEIGRAFETRLRKAGVEVRFATEVVRLRRESDAVTGVQARTAEGVADFLARSGVVLAAGGYQANFELRRRHQPHRQITPYVSGLSTARGIAHVLGAWAGGDLINMGYIQPMLLVPSTLVEDAIAVDRSGRRFYDEAGPYGRRVAAIEALGEERAHFIVDSETLDSKRVFIDSLPEPPVVGTLEELAAAIGCSPTALRETVSSWNGFLASADLEDPEFGRVTLPPGRRPLAAPPFAAIPITRGVTLTWGGLVVTRALQVVSVLGETIPGLFAAGDAIGGLNVISSMGGIHIAGALTLGRIAGRSAALGTRIEPHLSSPASTASPSPQEDVAGI